MPILILLPLLGGPPRTADATVFAFMDDETLVQHSAVIVTGTVTAVTSHRRDGRIVTDTVLAVTRVVKGAVETSSVTITTPGGIVGDVGVVLPGVPAFRVGESVLTFLEAGVEGTWQPVALGLGVFRLLAPATNDTVVRTEPFPETRTVAEVAAIAQADGDPGARIAGATLDDPAPVVDEFTFLGSPPSRWFEADRDIPVRYRFANADPTLGQQTSASVVDASLAAWTNVPDASIVLERGPGSPPTRTVAGGTCDGRNVIQFDDPFSEVPPLVGCSGVLAVGGFCVGGDGVFDGRQFRRISEGDLTINNGLGACIQRRAFEEIMTHEIGHTIGLGHSSENQSEPNAALRDATMFFLVHLDGRGASLRSDDIAGLTALYPSRVDPNDLDGDGVANGPDRCPSTPKDEPVDGFGCACGEADRTPCDDGLVCTADVCSRATGLCIAPAVDCTGGNSCLTGHCDEATGCSTTPVIGTAAIVCPYQNAFPPNDCSGEKVSAAAVRRFRRIGKIVGKAVDTGSPVFLERAHRKLDRLQRVLERAGTRRRRPLSPACVDATVAAVDDARARLAALD